MKLKTLKDLPEIDYLLPTFTPEEHRIKVVNKEDLRKEAIKWIKLKLEEIFNLLASCHAITGKSLVVSKNVGKHILTEMKRYLHLATTRTKMDYGAILEKMRFFNITEEDLK